MTKIDRIIELLEGIKWALWLIVCIAAFLMGVLLSGCNYQSPKECCSDRGGVQMCYHPSPKTDGYIMCKDGYICSNVRCQ